MIAFIIILTEKRRPARACSIPNSAVSVFALTPAVQMDVYVGTTRPEERCRASCSTLVTPSARINSTPFFSRYLRALVAGAGRSFGLDYWIMPWLGRLLDKFIYGKPKHLYRR